MSEFDGQIRIDIPPEARERKKAAKRRILAFVAGAAWLVLTIPAIGVARISVIVSDGGMSPAKYTFILACFTLPLTTLVAAVGGFVSGATGRTRFVAIVSTGPFIALLVAVGAIAFA